MLPASRHAPKVAEDKERRIETYLLVIPNPREAGVHPIRVPPASTSRVPLRDADVGGTMRNPAGVAGGRGQRQWGDLQGMDWRKRAGSIGSRAMTARPINAPPPRHREATQPYREPRGSACGRSPRARTPRNSGGVHGDSQ